MVQQARHRQLTAPRVIHRVRQAAVHLLHVLLEHLWQHGRGMFHGASLNFSVCGKQMQAQAVFRWRVMPRCPVYVQAAHSGNVSASVCLAQVDDARGDIRSALKYWAKAAKLGHPEAQFRLGRVGSGTVIDSCCWASVCLYKNFQSMSLAGSTFAPRTCTVAGVTSARPLSGSLYVTFNANGGMPKQCLFIGAVTLNKLSPM